MRPGTVRPPVRRFLAREARVPGRRRNDERREAVWSTGERPSSRGPDQTHMAHKKCSRFTRSVCPYSPSVLAPDVQRKRCRTPGNPSADSRRDRRHPLLFRQQRPGGTRRWPAAASFGGLVASAGHDPVPRRFAHRTTDMAPMLRHADPCRASPCRPCCLLSALNRARPRSRALSSPGAKAAGPDSGNAQPQVLVFLRGLPVARRPSRSNPCFSGRDAQGRRRQQRKLPDVGSALRSHNTELRDREAR